MASRNSQSPVSRGFFASASAMLVTMLVTSLMSMLAPASALAEPAHNPPASPATASCEAEYGGRVEKLMLQPTDDVYATVAVTLGERFRFQAQYLSGRAKLKTWVYELRERGPALLHAAEYPMPADACSGSGNASGSASRSAAGAGSIDFGLNKVYSSDLERELFFRCVRSCD